MHLQFWLIQLEELRLNVDKLNINFFTNLDNDCIILTRGYHLMGNLILGLFF